MELDCDFLYKPRAPARSGEKGFSTSWTRRSLNTDERTQTYGATRIENSVTSNLENLVLWS